MKYVHFRTVSALILATLLFSTVSAFGQSDLGSIVGYAKDPSGGVITKAKVGVKNEATGVEISTVTNDSGYFVVPNLQSGLYTVRVEAAGFKKYDSLHNKLDPDATLSLDAQL